MKRPCFASIVLIVLLFPVVVLHAQTDWVKTFGNRGPDQYTGVGRAPDGGYAAVGYYDFVMSKFLLMTRYDSDGRVLWLRAFDNDEHSRVSTDEAEGVIFTDDGGILVVGDTNSVGAGKLDALVMKLDAAGNVEWEWAAGGPEVDFFSSVYPTGDGNYFIAGATMSWGRGDVDGWVMKVNPDGEILWEKTYGGNGRDMVEAVIALERGGLVCGRSTSGGSSGQYDMWLLTFDDDGSILWQRTISGERGGSINGAALTDDGSLIIAGRVDRNNGRGAGYLAKLTSGGEILWQTVLDGPTNSSITAITAAEGDSCLFTGLVDNTGGSGRDILFGEIDGKGNLVSRRSIGGDGAEAAYSICTTGEDSAILVGVTESFDVYKTDAIIAELSTDGSCGPLERPADLTPRPASLIARPSDASTAPTSASVTPTAADNLDPTSCLYFDEFRFP